jgi:hypothetical protein
VFPVRYELNFYVMYRKFSLSRVNTAMFWGCVTTDGVLIG